MLSALGNIIRTFPILYGLHRATKRQRNFVHQKKSIIPEWCTNDHSRRMIDYAMRSTLIIGEGFAVLRNDPLSEKERDRFTQLGFAAPHLDDLSDQKEVNNNQLKALVTIPSQFFTLHQVELLCAKLLKSCYDEMPFPNETRKVISQLFDAQIKSRDQSNPTIEEDKLIRVSRLKGGFSVQLFHSLMAHQKSIEENKVAMQLGYVIQLLDDLFDIYKDNTDGIHTLANSKDLDHFFTIYQQAWQSLKQAVHRTSYPQSNKKKALTWWYLFISTAFMYLGQLKRSGIKNIQSQFNGTQQPIPFNWEWPDLLDGLERGLKEKFSKS